MSIKRFWGRLVLPGLLTFLLASCAAPVSTAQSSRQTVDDFIVAVRNDDLSTLKALLQRGVDPNLTDPQGQPALILAAREQAWNSFDVLLTSRRLKLDTPNRASETALMYLALLGQTERARHLIDLGAAVNRPGWTPLHYAATNGHASLVELLLDAHAYIDANAADGTTPLMMAARGDHLSTVNLLLRQGADPALKTRQGWTAADFARMKGHLELAQALAARIASPGNQSTNNEDIDLVANAKVAPQSEVEPQNTNSPNYEDLPEQSAVAIPIEVNSQQFENQAEVQNLKKEIIEPVQEEAKEGANEIFPSSNKAAHAVSNDAVEMAPAESTNLPSSSQVVPNPFLSNNVSLPDISAASVITAESSDASEQASVQSLSTQPHDDIEVHELSEE